MFALPFRIFKILFMLVPAHSIFCRSSNDFLHPGNPVAIFAAPFAKIAGSALGCLV
jgi:hypothetical protein